MDTNLPARTSEESLRNIEFSATDRPLADDVKRLGRLVGEILSEQRGPDFLELIEAIRVAAIRQREHEAELDGLEAFLATIDPATAEAVVRAFATYFNAVNLAERVHRIRRRRDYQRDATSWQPGSLRETMQILAEAGINPAALEASLAGLAIELVFTAHPTEAMRRALLEKEQEVIRGLVKDLDRNLTPQERALDRERMRMALTAAWQTAESPPDKPTVADELEHVGFYLSEVIYRVLPDFFEELGQAVRASFGLPITQRPVLRFASWVGGDMDGNPAVGAATIEATVASQRAMILRAYRKDLEHLAGLLSQSLERVQVDAGIMGLIEAGQRRFPDEPGSRRPRNADMPYRRLLSLMQARLEASLAGQSSGYAGPAEFIADLEAIHTSLLNHGGAHAGAAAVARTLWRARCFGFHLATLDVRQDSAVHDQALAQLLGDPDFAQRPAAERTARLAALLEGDAPATPDPATLPEPAHATLAVFRARARVRASSGPATMGPYIISMSRSAADTLAVLALARLAGVDAAAAALDVVPLFETVADLKNAPATLRALLADAHYRRHVAERGNAQMVMLGYSDSSKDAGLLASRVALQKAQIALLEAGRQFGVRVTFFHGRGGSMSRGGGKIERAVKATPPGAIDGFLRVTEQGEVIHRNYGLRALALRNFEQASSAVLRASLLPQAADAREPRWLEQVTQMAEVARRAYRALVHEDPGFGAYFRAATPIDLIERLRLGSRPAKRVRSGDIGALRAIPWVFSWAQTRSNLTAWYGVGTGLAHGIEHFGVEALREMAREWPFFAMLVDDLDMVLAKSDLTIFEGYSRLSVDHHERFYPRIAAEFQRTCGAVLAVQGADQLLSQDLRLRRSIRLRNPYVDPIHLLQRHLLQGWRQAGRPDDDSYRALVATVNGISAGVQNTG